VSAPISTVDNITYTLTDNIINQTIVVERNGIVLDGRMHRLQGDGARYGIAIFESSSVTLKQMSISGFFYGIIVQYPSGGYGYNFFLNNLISNNTYGISLSSTQNNTLEGNVIEGNVEGIRLSFCSYGAVRNNRVLFNEKGLFMHTHLSDRIEIYDNLFFGNDWAMETFHAYNNIIYHNDFINSTTTHVHTIEASNSYDDGYPSGGNYWSGHKATDLYSGPYQNETGSDGIGDTPYLVLDENNVDNYPLMNIVGDIADVNNDLIVDIFDVVLCAYAYGATPLDPNWNPDCDLAEPYGAIDIFDIIIIAMSYGEEYTP